MINEDWYISSKNPGKLIEFQTAISAFYPKGAGVNSRSFVDLGLDFELEVEEDGSNYGQNATKKAFVILEEYFKKNQYTGFNPIILADDSGIEVDALFGRPGLHSARWAGSWGNDNAPVTKLIREMSNIPDYERAAKYVCSLALLVPGNLKRFEDKPESIASTGMWNTFVCGRPYSLFLTLATLSGKIATEQKGQNGFAYDGYFIDSSGIHLAEYTNHAKSIISHRGKALYGLFRRLSEAGRYTVDSTISLS